MKLNFSSNISNVSFLLFARHLLSHYRALFHSLQLTIIKYNLKFIQTLSYAMVHNQFLIFGGELS